MKMQITLFLLIALLSSCEKTINFPVDASEEKLVVEATIEQDKAPVVVLTRSFAIFSGGLPSPDNVFIHDAEVVISNGTSLHQLREYAIPLAGGLTIYYYSNDTTPGSGAFTGQIYTEYTLTINHQGEEYFSTTSIPDTTIQIDSLWWKQAPEGLEDSLVSLMVKLTDPPGFGDYGRYFTKRNGEPFIPGVFSVFDDQIIDGTTYSVQLDRGIPRDQTIDDESAYFVKGDTISIRICNIDRATFDFWRTMEFSYTNIGNPFSTPVRVLGNISNNALGYFGGYACQERTIIVPE